MATTIKMRVLYLEDDKDSREMVTFLLSSSGIEVATATSSKEAARLAKSETFDLYLLDGLLPTGDSFELCRDLREYSPSIPIVFYTALGFENDVKKGLNAGANAYLVKPFCGDLAEVLASIILKVKMSQAGLVRDSLTLPNSIMTSGLASEASLRR